MSFARLASRWLSSEMRSTVASMAIEATVDRISLDNHRLAKRAKDIGSAAVLLSLVNLALVWALVLLR